ncbi:hypothetical protein JHK84_036034 [Glycine max]|nr:hypothetical protein JHK84_036034 [Glycine max]
MRCKSTIEPCSNYDSCNALLGYTLYTHLKASEVASLFQIDPIALLTANAIDISYPDVEHHILPSKLFLKVPITRSCVDGIRKSMSTHYRTRPSDTLSSIANSIYGGLVSPDQLREANSIGDDPSVLDVGLNLVVPLPCTCFNESDNSLPSIYLSYVVQPIDTLAAIAARYFTTFTDLMNVNDMGTTAISDGDILVVPIPAVSCSSMRCKNSNLMLGNVTVQRSSSGCNVTSCNYDGFVSGTTITSLSPSLQPRCPGLQRFHPLIAPPTSVIRESEFAFTPSLSPSQSSQSQETGLTAPKSSVMPATRSFPGFSPANGPVSRIASGASATPSLANPMLVLRFAFMLLLVKLLIPLAL